MKKPASTTRSTRPSTVTAPPAATAPKTATELNPVQKWEFKIRGRGTSGWMSYVKENGVWVKLRPSDTSFLSAVTAIEPEMMRKAFPHTNRTRQQVSA